MLMPLIFGYAFLTFMFIAIVSFFVWQGFREERSFLYWSIAILLQGIGWGSFSQINYLDNPLLYSITETAIFAGHIIAYLAFAIFSYKTLSKKAFVLAGILTIIFYLLDVVFRHNGYAQWDAYIALSHSVINTLMVAAILRQRRRENFGLVYSVVVVYLLLVIVTTSKALKIFISADPSSELSFASSINASVVLGATLINVVGMIALSLLAFTRSAQTMRDLATHDPLTQMLNRRAWNSALDREIKRARRYRLSLSIIMFDFDFFKTVNDQYGHRAGDETLKTISRSIRQELRDEDILCRYGGEEFLILLTGATLDNAQHSADRFRQRVAATPIHFEDMQFHITCSMGVAEYNAGMDTPESLVSRADKALYQAKNNGRNQVVALKPAPAQQSCSMASS